MDKTLTLSIALMADLFVGFGLGYALRAAISMRRHRKARERRTL
jgi:hypothetical protein